MTKDQDHINDNQNNKSEKGREGLVPDNSRTMAGVFDALSEFVIILDRKGRVIFVNRFALSGFEYLAEEFTDKSLTDFCPEDSRNEHVFSLNEFLCGDKRQITMPFVSKSGTVFWLEFSMSKVAWGPSDAFVLIGRGLEIRDETVRDFLNERKRLRLLIDHLPDYIYFKDKHHRFVVANRAMADLVGESNPDALNGKRDFDYFPEDIAGKFYDEEKKIFESGKPVINKEELFTGKNADKKIYLYSSRIPLHDSSGNISGLIGIGRNVSDLKKAKLKLNDLQASLDALIENTRNAIWSVDRNYSITTINTFFKDTFREAYGKDLDIGINVLEMLSGEEKKVWKKIYDRAFGGEQWVEEHSYMYDDKVAYFEIFVSPVFGENQEVTGATFLSHNVTRRKEGENELLKIKFQQKAILDNIPHLAWLKDSEGRYVSVNEPFAKYYAMQPQDFTGKTDFDICTPELAEKYTINDQDVIKCKKQKLFEEVVTSGNTTKWSETFKTPIINEVGEVIGITGISRDITARKQLEESLKYSEERFRALLQNSSDAITILDREGAIIFESSLRGKLSRLSFDELKGKSLFELIHPDDRDRVKVIFRKSLNNPEKSFKTEFRGIQAGQRWIYIESIFTNHLHNSLINGVVVNSRDISERKVADKKEEEFKDKLFYLSLTALEFLSISIDEDIFNYIGKKLNELIKDTIVLVASFDENIKTFSVKYISGIRNYEKQITDILGIDPGKVKLPISEAFRNQIMRNAKELYLYDGGLYDATDGYFDRETMQELEKLLDIRGVYSIALMRGGKLYGSVLIINKQPAALTDSKLIETFIYQASIALHRKQLENELIKAKEKAEESDKLKSAFLANMSHEIRTPLNGILGFSQLLNDDAISPELRREYSDIINSNGKVLTNLINDIIDISKIEAGQISLKNEVIALNAFLLELQSVFLSTREMKEKPDLKLRLVKTLGDDVNIISDEVRLRQVLTNLISNAIKFTEVGYVEFGYELTYDRDFLKFFVIDTGIGFSESKQKVIFDRFMQVDHTSTRKYGGSGLGLAISKGFIDLMGGKIWAESKTGEGSKFYFTVPFRISQKETHKKQVSRNITKEHNWQGKKLLIVEDDRLSYRYLEEILKRTGALILHASNGKEAIDLANTHKDVDLILMDLQLPEVSGYEATAEIRKFKKELPIIAQTANAMEEDRRRCIEIGFTEYITKPISIDILYSTIEKHLR
ncbi:MAG TPA: PAS domain S-box protein [Bacteroidales bacterium]|nr:PAS domain S-box protein [Bacteroidales bacterium]